MSVSRQYFRAPPSTPAQRENPMKAKGLRVDRRRCGRPKQNIELGWILERTA
jgi:hypothetical protein